MNREEFQNALRKGLGRAVQHVRNSLPETVRDDLAHACTHFLGMNRQEESGGRAEWLFSMIEATGEPDFYRQKVIAALEQTPDDGGDDSETFNELYSLLTEFAVRGDAESLAVMRRRFDTASVLYDPGFGFYELFRIDGIDALIRLLCREWKRIRDDETLWPPEWEIEYAEKELGKEAVQAALEKESLVNESVRLYLERLRRKEAERLAKEAKEEEDQAEEIASPLPRLPELIAGLDEDWPQETEWTDAAFYATFSRRRIQFLRSGQFYAMPTPEELEFAFQQLLETTDPGRQFCLLGIFVKETMPRLEPRLLSLLDTSFHLRWGSAEAFYRMANPLVRAKGLELVAKAPDFKDWNLGISLLEKNYQPEDESLLRRTLESVPADTDIHDLHSIVMSLHDLAAANAGFSFEPILLWTYENSPCPYCRGKSVELMIRRNIATETLLEECRDDSYEKTRKLVTEPQS